MKADVDLAEENVVSIITPGLDLARKYYKKLEASNADIIAMFINPSIRMEWIKNWSTRDQAAAWAAILAKLEFYRDQDDDTTSLSRSTKGVFSQKMLDSSRPEST
ncbi:hypothetical protein K438DRAFT_1786164 [Mycena galopus ATCC 62051]|nr:hypothetical protein K438DRAFT_1786164 [Mycena galopus ATCC 62051]